MRPINNRNFIPELDFQSAKSSGPGGQHVNKSNTKVILRFNIEHSQLLSLTEKKRLIEKLSSKLTSDNELIITNQESRSQIRNKEAAIEQFYMLLSKALAPVKKRFKTKPTRASVEKRLSNKKNQALKKASRRLKGI
ncbi:alternative ribosome rescue aminoacyl-tRNA hydrolase ArfB [Carboxylicivirga taeanensis]|uniref:alternative ribosome rescue aminoacyl-tRNA hydrolase ArfB n=1 Tax=Carboxylicivirga taeanensis TaxID=1416875 RepID=UPI003F6DB96C